MTTTWLIDRSALARVGTCPDHDQWLERVERGLVQITTPTVLEVGYSARSWRDWTNRVLAPLASSMPLATSSPRAERRAVEVQGLRARRGHPRAPSVPDLLIAAIAEVEDLVVLHVDEDFDLIAEVTGQPVERLRLE